MPGELDAELHDHADELDAFVRHAQRVKIAIPTGWTVNSGSIVATTQNNVANTCKGDTNDGAWTNDGTIVSGGKINLKNNGGATELCPGAQLVVTFTATTNNTAGTISWATEMTREFPEKQHFYEIRTQPTVILDNTAPTVTINQASGQADPTTVSPINFTATFSEPVTGFTTRRRHDHRHGRRDEGRHRYRRATTYNVAVTGMTSRGTVIASIPAGAAQRPGDEPEHGLDVDRQHGHVGPPPDGDCQPQQPRRRRRTTRSRRPRRRAIPTATRSR